MAIQADELQIKINLDVQADATKQIGKIVSGIENLKRVTKGSDGLKTFSDSIGQLSSSLASLKNSNRAILSIGNSISTLFDYLKGFDAQKYASGIGGLNAAMDKLGKSMETFTRRASGVQEAARGAMYIQNAAMGLTNIQVPDDAKANLDKIADSIKKVSQYGTSFNNLTSGLKRLPEAIQGMRAGMDDKAFLTLNNTVARLNTALAGLNRESASTFSHVAQGIETLNRAGVSPDLAKNLEAAAKACNDFIQAFGKGISDEDLLRFYQLAEALDKVTEGYKHLNAAQNGAKRASNGSGKGGFFAGLSAVFAKIPSGGQFAEITAGIEKLSTKSEGLSGNLGKAGVIVGIAVAAFKILQSVVKSINETFDKHVKIIIEIINKFKEVGIVAGTFVAGAFKKGASAVAGFISNVKKINAAISNIREKISDTFGSLSKSVESVFKKLTKAFHMIANTLSRMIIRKVINAMFSGLKEALDRLVNYSRYAGTQFAESMDTFATSSRYFSNSLIAMFSPIINAVMPILDKFVDKLVEVMNKINEFVSFMSGASSWTSAIKVPIKYATAAEKAAKKQKELNNSILAFDEINRLNGDNNKDDDNEGIYEFKENPFGDWLTGLNNISLLFDNLVKKQSTFTDKVKGFLSSINWEKIYLTAFKIGDGIMRLLNVVFGDSELGRLLGETLGKTINTAFWFALGMINRWDPAAWAASLTNFVKGALDSLDWRLIKATVGSFGTKLAEYFNGIFQDKKMFESIGTAIYNGVDTVVLGASKFIKKLKWDEIGKSIGIALNNALGAINYYDLFTTISEGINGIFEMLKGWLSTTNFGFIARQIIAGIGAGFSSIDWKTIYEVAELAGQKLTDALNSAFSNELFWANIGTTIANGFNSALTFVSSAINNLNWGQIGTSIGYALNNLLNGFNWEELGVTFGNLVNGIFTAAQNVAEKFDWTTFATNITTGVKSALDTLDWETINSSVTIIAGKLGETFNVLLSDTEMWAKIGKTVGNALSTAIQGLAAFFEKIDPIELSKSIITFFNKAVDGFIGDSRNEEAIQSLVDWIATFLESLIAGYQTSGLYEKIDGFLRRIDWSKLFGAISQLMAEIAITKFKIQLSLIGIKLHTWFHEYFVAMPGRVLDEAGKTISNGFTTVFNTVKGIFDSIGKTISGVIDSAVKAVTGGIETIKKVFDFKWSLPKLKLPHFSITGHFSLDPPSIPHFSVDWYKKAMDTGMILNGATIFGVNSAGGLMGGGEAGAEVVVGADSLSQMIKSSIAESFNAQSIAAAVVNGIAGMMNTVDNAPTVDLTLNVDSETLYRMVRKGENSYNGRYRIIEGVT